MSGPLTNEDADRASLAETCANCGARISQDGATPLRCLVCGTDLHGQEREWHRPARPGTGCAECGRGFGPRGEDLHWPGCSKADTARELSKRAHPSRAPVASHAMAQDRRSGHRHLRGHPHDGTCPCAICSSESKL